MGLFGKHKGKAKAPFTFGVLVHTLAPFPAGLGPVCVIYERGSHSGATQPSSPSRGSAAYVFEQQLVVPATLYQRQVTVMRPPNAPGLPLAAAAAAAFLQPPCSAATAIARLSVPLTLLNHPPLRYLAGCQARRRARCDRI